MAKSSLHRGPSNEASGSLGASVPLARLFAMAFRSLIEGLHERLAETRFADVRPAYGFVLLAVRTSPLTVGEIAALLGMTKQAASKLVDSMEAGGYVRRVTSAEDRRARCLRLTRRGYRALETVEAIYAELEAEWHRCLGRQRVEGLRSDLIAVLEAQNGGNLPAVRPTW